MCNVEQARNGIGSIECVTVVDVDAVDQYKELFSRLLHLRRNGLCLGDRVGCRGEVVSRWAGVRVGRRRPVSRTRGCRRWTFGTFRTERLCARRRQCGGDKGFLDKSQVSDRVQNVP